MKKLYTLSILLLLFCSFSLSAQHVITEYSSGTLNESIISKRHFDERNYTKVLDENGKKVYLQNQVYNRSTPQTENVAEEVTLNVNLEFDQSQFFPWMILIYNESGFMKFEYWQGSNIVTTNVPAGVYDIQVEFIPVFSGKPHVIIKEEQNIQEGTTVEINPDDAVNYVSITTYDENGEILTPGVENPNTSSPSTMYFDRSIHLNPLNSSPSGVSFVRDEPFEDGESAWNFYINDVSDRYTIFQTLIGWGYEQGNYFTKYPSLIGIQESITLENNPEDWVSHIVPFQPSIIASEDEVYPGVITSTIFNESLLSGWTISSTLPLNQEGDSFKAFLDNPLNDNPLDLLVSPAIFEYSYMFDPNYGEESFFIKGNPVVSDGIGGVLYGSGDVASVSSLFLPLLGNDYFRTENSNTKVLPFHPRFTFDNTTTAVMKQGNNVPIAITGFNVLPNETNTFRTLNKGRYGENRESDFFATQIEAKQNGSVIFSGAYLDFIDFDLPTNGQMEIVLTNENTMVEEIAGKNITTINYNADVADAPPTLQHFQFRNTNDEVTNIFNSSEDASIRIAAGDFKYTLVDDWTGYYAYQEGNNVEVHYSICNQNDWTKLGLTEYPEYFQMPAFGDYYEASLSEIENEDENVWYDIKVICTDAGGNTQEQLISPAFKLNNTVVGVEDIQKSNFVVYPNPNDGRFTINSSLTKPFSIEIIDATGRLISTYPSITSGKTEIEIRNLSSGIYFINLKVDGRVDTQKLLIK